MSNFLLPQYFLRSSFPVFQRKTSLFLSSQFINSSVHDLSFQGKILYSTQPTLQELNGRLLKVRNIGISAHIDSGKTTLTERVLYYSGRIREIHEVRGKDGIGAKMDSMDLEREKGITIQSAATYVSWNKHHINIIDTPGHVDFTIEVERALRVLDGAILVICGVGGLQSQTYTVDRQMRRYSIPRLTFINKLDRAGADPWKIISEMRAKLGIGAAAVQIPIGLADKHTGVIDIIKMRAFYFGGSRGQDVTEADIPKEYLNLLKEKREELIHQLVDHDEGLANIIIEQERDPTIEEIKEAVRRTTLARTFSPVFMGSAVKNKAIQNLLDGVVDYLPNPTDMSYHAFDMANDNSQIPLKADSTLPFVGFAFKLDEGRFGQLTYIRVYQGTLAKGATILNIANGRRFKVPRIVRMHSNEMEDVDFVGSGEICAMFGIECHSGTTFTEGQKCTMMSMHVPKPVMSLSITNNSKQNDADLAKALNRFQKEDPTFQVSFDNESRQTIISGMGELHLFIYTERLKREYGVSVTTGQPLVALRETVYGKATFSYLHKKQSGGRGQFAKVCGYVEPYSEDEFMHDNEFVDHTIGGSIPPEFMVACRKGFEEALDKGFLSGNPIAGVRMVVNDGASHPVDSSDLAFKLCTGYAFKEGFLRAKPTILEPIMTVTVTVPSEYANGVIAGINRKKGLIVDNQLQGEFVVIVAELPLNTMFGYSTDLRSITQGKGEFIMEYCRHAPATKEYQQTIIDQYEKKLAAKRK